MKFAILDIEPTQVTVEADNESAYNAPGKIRAHLNGVCVGEYDKNVFTIDGLTPDTRYELKLEYAEETTEASETAESTEKSETSAPSTDGSRENSSCSRIFFTEKETVRLNVRRFGARGDGVNNDTASVEAAIMACPEGGTVYLDAGDYLCAPIFLKSNIRIHLDEGARILGLADRSAYPVLPGMVRGDEYFADMSDCPEYDFGTWEGNPLDCFASLITGIGVENVKIYGKGTIDGNAAAGDWWKDPKIKRIAWRPHVVFLERCRNVTLQGITVCNSPSWTILPFYSEDINILELMIRNPDNSPNTDGIDPESSVNVNIIGTDISVGDDCIAIKSGKYYMALNHYKRTEHIIVRNCLLNHGHGSVTVGSECAGGVTDVHVDRCIFRETDRGLRIKTRRGRGARSVLDEILFENIKMDHVRMPFTINMYYFCDPDGHSEYCQSKEAYPADDMTPAIRSITARNIECDGVDVSLLAAYGLPESKVGSICLENINATYLPEGKRTPGVPLMMDGLDPMSGRGIYVRNAELLFLKNVRITGCDDSEPDVSETDRIASENVVFD